MNTTENNRLIDSFMGSNTIELSLEFSYEIGDELFNTGLTCKSVTEAEQELKQELELYPYEMSTTEKRYDNCWDILMPVAKKIYDTYGEMGETEQQIDIQRTVGLFSLKTLYDECVGHIKRINKLNA